MDGLRSLTRGQNAAALVFAFLQADCSDSDYIEELRALRKELSVSRDTWSNGSGIECPDDGDLEADGHLPCSITDSLADLQPSVDPWPGGRMEAAAFRRVVEELREVAAQLEQEVLARGIQNLNSHISASPSEQWKHHLAREVERAMRQCVGLDHVPQERVIMALTLALVRGVCVQAPRMLRRLFATALQLISLAR